MLAHSHAAQNQGYRKRRAKRPNLPKTLEEVNIEAYPDLTSTKDGKPFYRGKTDSGSELFMSDVQMDIAAESESIFIDGTFSICPQPFFQVVFISGKVGENVYPIATALCPNKLETTYHELLEKLKTTCEENGRQLDFVYAHSDCEMAIINAVRKVFPSVQIRLCRFHIIDAIRRYCNSKGLRGIINRRADFKRFYTRIRQVFFFPCHMWPRLFKLLVEQLGPETKAIPGVMDFVDYMVSH